MHAFHTWRLRLTVLFLLLMVSTGFSYKKIKVFVIEPPSLAMPGVKQIAIMDFDGPEPYGNGFAESLISQLLQEQRGITDIKVNIFGKTEEGRTLQEGTFCNVYEIVERSRLEAILSEQSLGLSGVIDQNQAVQLGQVLGVQALITGSINYTKHDGIKYENRDVKKNDQKQTVKVKCTERQVNAVVRIRVVSAVTGEVLGSTEASRSYKAKQCEDGQGGVELPQILGSILGGLGSGNLFGEGEIVEHLIKEMSEEIASYLAPTYAFAEFEFEKIEIKTFKDKAEEAAKLAEDHEVDQAYSIYKTMFGEDAYNTSLIYNLGILEEVVGNFNAAKEYYEMALQLKSSEKKYREAVQRINKNVEYSAALAELGVVLGGYNWPQEGVDLSERQLEIKGGKSERINVYAQPEEGSEVAAQVPGGLMFIIQEENDNFYRIELLGGKTGYVNKKDAKVK